MAQRYVKGKGVEQPIYSSDSEDTPNADNAQPILEYQPDEQPDDQADAARRRLIRQRALANRTVKNEVEQEESADQQSKDSEGGSEDEEQEDSEDDNSEDEEHDPYQRILLKPVFISKSKRETIIERHQDLAQKKREEEHSQKKAQERKAESSEMVMEALRKEMEEIDQKVVDLMVDDTDNLNPEEEEEAWKLRELERILRNKKTKEMRIKQEQEIERRRNMTDAQVEEENNSNVNEKQKYNFLQKYYHKGAFAVDERVEEIMKRTNANAPTLEDKFDKSVLPEVMQVKNFGLKGRTKYTHLTDQDTTEVFLLT